MRLMLSDKLLRLEDQIRDLMEKYEIPEDYEDAAGIHLDELSLAIRCIHSKYIEAIIDEEMLYGHEK